MDKTNAADLSSGVFAILISVTGTKKIQSIAIPQISLKTGKQEALNCTFIAADNIVDSISIYILEPYSELHLSSYPSNLFLHLSPDPPFKSFQFTSICLR